MVKYSLNKKCRPVKQSQTVVSHRFNIVYMFASVKAVPVAKKVLYSMKTSYHTVFLLNNSLLGGRILLIF